MNTSKGVSMIKLLLPKPPRIPPPATLPIIDFKTDEGLAISRPSNIFYHPNLPAVVKTIKL